MNIALTEPMQTALDYIAVDRNEFILKATENALRSKLNYIRNGTRLKDAVGATHSHQDKKGKTIYYKGGLKETAALAYKMAAQYLPMEINEGKFVADQLAEIDSIISVLSAKLEDINEAEE